MTAKSIWTALGAAAVAMIGIATIWSSRADAKLAPEPHAAAVSYLEGKAERTPHGAAVSDHLKLGDPIAQGDIVATEDKSRLELKLDDQSIIRLGPGAKMALTEAQFGGGDQQRSLSVKLFFGNIWAKVTSMVGSDQRFNVETENAVAGVRGTTFRVDAHADKSVLVRVYNGSVAVAKPAPGPASPAGTLHPRHEVQGPAEVSRDTWEKLVGAQMQIVISAKGVPGEPTPFTPADEDKDSWAKWNEDRDGK